MQKWLLVDDDLDDQEIFEIALQEVDNDIELKKSSNGMEALRYLREASKGELPGKIFMDINMPHMDGKECIKEIKKDPLLNKIPVIMYTTSAAENEIALCMQLGASDFITKPTNIIDLIEILKKFRS